MTVKRRLAAGGLAAALALTGVAATAAGAAWAVGAETTSESDATSSERPSLVDRITEALAGLVDDGTITQDQAAAVAESLASSESIRGGPRGGGHHGGMDGMRPGLDAAAETLGMTEDELRTALRDGDTLAQLAEERGVAVEDLVDALVAVAEERLAEAVADGRITEERADVMAENLAERIAEQVEESWESRGPGGPRGRMGQPDDRATEDSA